MKREGEIRIPSGCAISGFISKERERRSGDLIVKSMVPMHDRSNGLGGGFAGYGIYPDNKEHYAFHMFFDDIESKIQFEELLRNSFNMIDMNSIPTTKVRAIKNKPYIYLYFAVPIIDKLEKLEIDEKEYVARFALYINEHIKGAYVCSCGKNMGVFKAVGFPEDVGEFYRLNEYKGWCWTAHGRYPTNTPGWWGGAHPFSLLDYTIVHNGEISSYDANRRYIEMHDYNCTLLTDTEVITYMIDYLNRKKGLTLQEVSSIIAAPFWDMIDEMEEEERKRMTYLRNTFSNMLITGPFSILLGFENGLMALNDRLKLRSMVVAEKGETVYIASEECAIRAICPDAGNMFSPKGGEAVIITLNEEKKGK